MELKSGSLYWPTTVPAPVPARGQLDTNVACEVLVVGGGISGAMAAYVLATQGRDVIVVDRARMGQGSTAASTALLLYELDKMLIDLTNHVGEEAARAAYRASRRALDSLDELAGKLGIAKEIRTRRSLFLARDVADFERLRAEAKAREECGIRVELLGEATLRDAFGIARPGALLTDLALEGNPLSLAHALLTEAARYGTRLFEQTELEFPTCDHGSMLVCAAHGPTIRCRHMVIATGYEAPKVFAEVCRRTRLRTTFATATARVKGLHDRWKAGTLVWEVGDPYFYARTTPDERVIMGGEDIASIEPSVRDPMIGENVRRLAEGLDRIFLGGLPTEPEWGWCGTFAETADGLPLIGALPKWPHVHFALGFGGNGITFSLIAAQASHAAITGNPRPEDKVFGFDRPSAVITA